MDEFVYRVYERTGAYFTGSQRKKPLYVFLVLIFVLLFVFKDCLAQTYGLSIGVGLFSLIMSGLIQALLALVGLMGVVSIFKLQRLDGRETRILELTPTNPDPFFKGVAYLHSQALLTEVNNRIKEGTNITQDVKNIQINLEEINKFKGWVIDYAGKFTVYTFAVSLVALVFLIFSEQIILMNLGLSTLYLVFVFTSYSLFLATKGFIQTLN